MSEMVSDIRKSDKLVISQDGWENNSSDPILAHSFFTGEKSYLHNIKDCGSTKKTAEYCLEALEEAIDQIHDQTGKDLVGVVTENEAKMVKMRALLLAKNPKMLCYGCKAHYLNLLENDIADQTILDKVMTVQKYFKNVHRAHGLLKEKNGKMAQLYNDTRWNSKISMLENFLDNDSLYLEIIEELHDDKHKDVQRIVENLNFKRKVQANHCQMVKFLAALDQLQSDSCTLSDTVKVWLSLINDEQLQQVLCSLFFLSFSDRS